MNLEEKVARLQVLIDTAPEERGSDFAPWRDEASTLLRHFLGGNNDFYNRFQNLRFAARVKDNCRSALRDEQAFNSGMNGAKNLLRAAAEELKLIDELDADRRPQDEQQGNEVFGVQYAESMSEPAPDPKRVFVIHGRNDAARREMFTFLRAIGLHPTEWAEALHATGTASPYIGDVLDTAFGMAQALVVLMTPDEVAYLLPAYKHSDDDPEGEAKPQARPNVLFEAGMAMGRDPRRTVLVELGVVRPFSDVAGRHAVRLAATPEKRKDLAQRLKTAGCDVNLNGDDWMQTGDFSAPEVPGGPVGRRVPSSAAKSTRHLDARFLSRSSASDRIQLINVGSEDVLELTSPNEGEFQGRIDGFPISRLPAGKSVTLICMQVMGGPDTFDLIVEGRTESGEAFSEPLFLDLNG